MFITLFVLMTLIIAESGWVGRTGQSPPLQSSDGPAQTDASETIRTSRN